jgi:hypothetical protein
MRWQNAFVVADRTLVRNSQFIFIPTKKAMAKLKGVADRILANRGIMLFA